MKPNPPICVALDRPDLASATDLVSELSPLVGWFKVGLQLYTAAGPAAVEMVKSAGGSVFLDLKVSDIPNTAAGAVRAAGSLGADLLTIHGSGGFEMVRASVEAANETSGLKILVVSVLTSLDRAALGRIGVERTVEQQVDAMAELAADAGAPGLVLAASEVGRVRAGHPDLFLLVPGIRPAWASGDDQKRVGTPAAAIEAGADLLVLGRAVTAAQGAGGPAEAMSKVLDEVAAVETRKAG